jgi:hypothetical protein
LSESAILAWASFNNSAGVRLALNFRSHAEQQQKSHRHALLFCSGPKFVVGSRDLQAGVTERSSAIDRPDRRLAEHAKARLQLRRRTGWGG